MSSINLWKKISFGKFSIVFIIFLILGILVYGSIFSNKYLFGTISVENYEGKDYYVVKGDYKGDYSLEYISFEDKDFSDFQVQEVVDYIDYKRYCDKWGIKQEYFDSSSDYIMFSYVAYGSPILKARLAAVEYDDSNVNLYIWDDASGFTADVSAYVFIIPAKENVNNVVVKALYSSEEYDNIKKFGTPYDPGKVTVDKPMIYLYPEEQMNVSVRLLNSDKLTCSYPVYDDLGWRVSASSDGKLVDLKTGRNLYGLYYESESVVDFKIYDDGFVVSSNDIVPFLEEKLAVLGLNEYEAQEFIVYWLPILQKSSYNYIRFATMEEINENAPLAIEPTPDSIIRILMTYKGLDAPIEVREQQLISQKREGFVVVEWGGLELP